MNKIKKLPSFILLGTLVIAILVPNVLGNGIFEPEIETVIESEEISQLDFEIKAEQKIFNIYEIAYIETEIGESPVDEEAIQYMIDQGIDPNEYRGIYIKWYKALAKNAWGWTMFTLCARGIFIFAGDNVMVVPYSYARSEWWCDWAWEKGDLTQIPSEGSDWGQVNAECDFTYWLGGGTVGLWAYVRCYSNGQVTGDGGQS